MTDQIPTEAAARSEEASTIAGLIAKMTPVGFEMNPDGTEDRERAAYVEGLRDAHDIARARATAEPSAKHRTRGRYPMSEIRKAAEECYPDEPDNEFVGDGNQSDARDAFIAGAEWMREQAAQVADSEGHIWSGSGEIAAFRVAENIRKIGASDD